MNGLFTCQSSTNLVWFYNGEKLPDNARYYNNNSLRITRVKKQKNWGYYECQGNNENGNTFHAVALLRVRGNWAVISYQFLYILF